MTSPSTVDIRKFLIECFSDEELTTFCFDYFRDVYEVFASGMSKAEKVQRLIERCIRRKELPELLGMLKRERPGQYQQYFGASLDITTNKLAEHPASVAVQPETRDKTGRTRVSPWIWVTACVVLLLLLAGITLIPSIMQAMPPSTPMAAIPEKAVRASLTSTPVPAATASAETLIPTSTSIPQVLIPTTTPKVSMPTFTAVIPSSTPIRQTSTPTQAPPTLPPTLTPMSLTLTPTLAPGSTRISERDGVVMVYVPAGEFVMGSADSDAEAEGDEKLQHKVTLNAFWIDRTEVTKELYQRCVAVKKCAGVGLYDVGEQDQPVVGVRWLDAASYCAWVDRRLPTEAEWEKAARGTDGRKYPWGGELPDCHKLNYNACGIGHPVSVGSYTGFPSPYGVFDMAGNVWEWTSSLWGTNFLRPDFGYPYRSTDGRENSAAPNSTWRVFRGGSYDDQEKFVRVTVRFRLEPDASNLTLGFRCARSP